MFHAKSLTLRHARRHARRLTLVAVLSEAARWLMVLGFTLGLCVLAARRIDPTLTPLLPWIAAAHGIVWVLLLARAVRVHGVSVAEATLDADRRLDAGGLYITLAEHDDARWAGFVEWKIEADRPLALPFGRLLLRALPGLAFLGMTFALPAKGATAAANFTDLGQRLVADLDRDLGQLRHEGIVDDARAATLSKEIASLRNAVSGGQFGAQEWEAADQIRKLMGGDLRRSVEELAEVARDFDAQRDNPVALLAGLPKAMGAIERSGLLNLLPKEFDKKTLATLATQALTGRLDPAEIERNLAPLEQALTARARELSGIVQRGGGRGLRDGNLDGALRALSEVLSGANQPRRGPLTQRNSGVETRLHQRRLASTDPVISEDPRDPGSLFVPDNSESAPLRGTARPFERVEQETSRQRHERPRHRGVVKRYFETSPSDNKD